MKLLTQAILKAVPALYETDGQPLAEKKIHAKFFTPDANWTWYMTEFDPETGEAFGLVDGMEREWGYFSMPELEGIKGPMGLPIERDQSFGTPTVQEAGLA